MTSEWCFGDDGAGARPRAERRCKPPARLGRSLLAFLIAAGVGGCGPDANKVGERAGGSLLSGSDTSLAWVAEPVFTVGGADAPEWAAFTEVTDVGFDAAGRLYILDGPAGLVTVVDTAGQPSETVGAPGDGPGELRFPGGLAVHPDGSVTVVDPGHGGFVVFDAEGDFLRTVPIDPADPGLPPGPLLLGPKRGIYGTGELRPGSGEGGDDAEAGRPVVRFTDSEGGTAEVLYRGWRPPTPGSRELTPEETGGLRVRLPPVLGFHPHLHVAPLPEARVAVVDSFAYRVRVVDRDGTVLHDLRRPIEPRPVTARLREMDRTLRLQSFEASRPRRVVNDRSGRTAVAPTDALVRLERARIDAMGFHPLVPVVARLAADPQGRIWVERTGLEPGRPGPTDLLTADGRYLGTLPADGLRIPDAFGPRGLAAWVEVDGLGAAVVRVARIEEER